MEAEAEAEKVEGEDAGLLSDEELKSFGFLGPPPDVIRDASMPIVKEWKRLAGRARSCAKQPFSYWKVKQAQWIERRRASLIEWASLEKLKREKERAHEADGDRDL